MCEKVTAFETLEILASADQGIASLGYLMIVLSENRDGPSEIPRDVIRAHSLGRIVYDTLSLKERELELDSHEQFFLGYIYSEDSFGRLDLHKSIDYFQGSAERGLMFAQYALGMCYITRRGVFENVVEASRWFRLSAEQGHPRAQFYLHSLSTAGKGVQTDHEESAKWIRLAAEQGHTTSQLNYGTYLDTQHRYTEAVYWYRLAAENGQPKAMFNLGNNYMKGLGVVQNWLEAIRLWRLASDSGVIEATFMLGYTQLQGLGGTPVNLVEGIQNVRQAAESGFATAQCALGMCFTSSIGVEKNYVEAVRWFRAAAEQGNADAELRLGQCYLGGHGVPRSSETGLAWIRRSADHGNKDAIQYLRSNSL